MKRWFNHLLILIRKTFLGPMLIYQVGEALDLKSLPDRLQWRRYRCTTSVGSKSRNKNATKTNEWPMKHIFEQSRLNFLPLSPLDLIEVGWTAQFRCVVGLSLMTLQTQTPPDYSAGKQEVLIHTVIRAELCGGTMSQHQVDWLNAHRMEKSFLSLLQDARISDRYSVARGSSDIVDLTTEIQMQWRRSGRSFGTPRAIGPPKVCQETQW